MNTKDKPLVAMVNWKYRFKYFVFLNLGLICTAIGIAVFKAPNNLVFGGTSGIAVLVSTLLKGINVGTAMWLINIVLVILGIIFLGLKKMEIMIYSSFALSFFVSVIENIFHITEPLTNEIFLEFCFAVIFPAIGTAIAFNIGASTGGTDIVAVILSKYTSLEVGKALMMSDFGITFVAMYIYGPKIGLFCILGIVLKSTIIDSVIESMNLRKVCTIVCTKPEAVREFIIEELHRTATIQTVYGAYKNEEKKALMTVLTRSQAARLRNFIKRTDPQAFITIVNSSEIIGKGFRDI